jgi:kynurenine formamidase
MVESISSAEAFADIGALNRISTAELLAAFALVERGQVYDLGLEVGEHIPPGPGTPFSIAFKATPEGSGRASPFQFAVETIISNLHCGTHMDAFVHVQGDGRVYGGARAVDARDDGGWKQFGMETVPPILGRCVLLDVAGMKGWEALPDGYEVTVADLQACVERSGTALKKGDVVLVRTGKIREFYTNMTTYGSDQPGVGPSGAVWLYEQGMAALGTDTTGTEPLPMPDPAHSTHRAMLVDRGVHLLENIFLDDLAHDGVVEAFFICLPLRIKGATGSWIRPIAMV